MMRRYEKNRVYMHTSLKTVTCLSVLLSMISTAAAGERDDAHFFEEYNLSLREKCEMIRSWPSAQAAMPEAFCENVSLFDPIRTLDREQTPEALEISLSSSGDGDWPLTDIRLQVKKNDAGRFLVTSTFLDKGNYDLSEYFLGGQRIGFDKIEIGYIGEAIILQFKGQSYTQISIVPIYCQSDELNYTEYGVSQVFSWYAPMQGHSFAKTFINSPSCT